MSWLSVAQKLFEGIATGKLSPVRIASDLFITIVDAGAANEGEQEWINANNEAQNKLIDDTLIALDRLPTGPQFKNTKPIVKPTKNAPKPKNKPVSQPPTKFPSTPNTFVWPVDPFWVPKELVKRVRAISGTPATEQKYGEMELWPVNYEETTFNVRLDIIGTARREENKQKGTENFIKWFARKNGNFSSAMIEDSQLEGGGVITGDTLWDQCCYFTPQTPGDFTGPMAMEFGAAAILDRAADLASTRVNASHGGIRGVLWAKQPTINIVPSGSVDISDRLPNDQFSSSYDGAAAALKDLFQYYGQREIKQLDIINTSQGAISRRLGVGDELFITRTLIDRTKEEELAVLNEEIKILTESMASLSSPHERELASQAIADLQKEISEVESGLVRLNQIHSLPELGAETLAILGEVIGAFPIKIDIKSGHLLTKSIAPKEGLGANWARLLNFGKSDLNKTVDPQEVFEVRVREDMSLNFPNIAESLAEIQLNLLNMSGIQNLQQEMLNRVASQLCSLASTSVTTHDLTDAIADYLGFKITYHDDYYTLAFDPQIASDPENDDLLKFLIGRNVHYKRPAFDISKESQTLTAKLFWYDRASSIIQAKDYRRFTGGPENANMSKPKERLRDVKNFMGHLREMAQDMGYLDATDPANPKVKKGVTWQEWKDLFEKGFAEDTTSTADDVKYWNEPKENRPKVTDGKSILADNDTGKIYGVANDKPKNWYPS